MINSPYSLVLVLLRTLLSARLGSTRSPFMATGHRKSTELPGRSVLNPKVRDIHSMRVSLALTIIQHIRPEEKSEYGDQDQQSL